MRTLVWVLAATGFAGAVAADAATLAVGGTIQSGDASFVRTSSSFDTTPEAHLTGVSVPSGQDYLFELGWWIRLSTGAGEVPFGDPSFESYVASESDIRWNSAGGTGLTIREIATVFDAYANGNPGDGGILRLRLEIDNFQVDPISVSLYHYFDIDVSGTASEDSANRSAAQGLFQFRDASHVAYVMTEASGPSSWSVVEYPGLRDLLNNGSQTQLLDCCLPFGPGDATGGFQWEFTLLELGSYEVIVYYGMNAPLTCGPSGVFCDGFASSDLLFWSTSSP